MIVLIVAAVLVAVFLCRFAISRHVERTTAARLPARPGSLAAGAGAIDLRDPALRDAVLLIHGFGDTPQTIEPLARDLHARGYAVYAPLLPGHGRTLREFRASTAAQWIATVRQAFGELRQRHERVGVAGLSMGGALAVMLAAEHPDLSALALLAPYLEPRRRVRWVARIAPVLSMVVPYLSTRDTGSIHDPVAREAAISYGAATPHLIAELVRVADRARAALGEVRAPTVYVQSREDNRLSSEAATRAFAALGAGERAKRLEWLTGCGHVITVDYCWHHAVAIVGGWMDEQLRTTSSHKGVPA